MAPLLDVSTPIYNVATIGLEPARLGTGAPLPTDPPGPLPIIVTLRTADSPGHTADFGIDSTVNEVPFRLGAFGAKAAQFDTLLCGKAPCTGGFTSSSPTATRGSRRWREQSPSSAIRPRASRRR